jgi:uncharacterized protein YjbJ (UPF0337 family)
MKTTMSGKSDRAKGKLKEATGVLTNDKRLEREGKLDRAAGEVKEKMEEVVDKVKEKARAIVETTKSMDKH